MEHPDHNAFAEMHRRREHLRRLAVAKRIANAIALVCALLLIGTLVGMLIGMAMTTAEAMPAFLADAQIRARG